MLVETYKLSMVLVYVEPVVADAGIHERIIPHEACEIKDCEIEGN